MTGTEPNRLDQLIEEALTLSSKADDDPTAAQALTDLLKQLQGYNVRSCFPGLGGKRLSALQGLQD
jgi:hypothetical protein